MKAELLSPVTANQHLSSILVFTLTREEHLQENSSHFKDKDRSGLLSKFSPEHNYLKDKYQETMENVMV